MRILDAHCHTWARWPYTRDVLGADEHARPDGLDAALRERGASGALVVCADLDGADDTGLVVAEARRRTGWVPAIDVDSRWSGTYHSPGSANRLERALDATAATAIAHYLGDDDDGWFSTADAESFFEVVEDRGVLVSLHAPPPWHESLARLAERHPRARFLLHHFGLPVDADAERRVLGLARTPNVALKASGWYYTEHASSPAGGRALLARVVDAFGPHRVVWGSDWPVQLGRTTPRLAFDLVADAPFLDDAARAAILGGNLTALLVADEVTT